MSSFRISKWRVSLKKYLLSFSNGFFEIPYISNSPELMIASLQLMPLTQHDLTQKTIYTNNPFTEGTLFYRELEEGFWLIATEIEFKRNICTKVLYVKAPIEYYFLTHFRYNGQENNKPTNNASICKNGWSFFRPGSKINSYFLKGNKGIFLNFAFNANWFNRNLELDNEAETNNIKQYLESDKTDIFWKDIVLNADVLTNLVLKSLKEGQSSQINNLSLKILCLDLMNRFFKGIINLYDPTLTRVILESDRERLAQAEKILEDSLTNNFPGIEAICKAVNMSATKLKADFKLVYGKSLFQSYQEKQMLFALELMQSNQTPVKEVAQLLGYENANNFKLAFKKWNKFLPTDI